MKNFASLTGAEAFGKLINFTAFAYLARIFGPTGFGYIEWSAAVLMCASLIVDQGFSSYGAREIAKNPAQTPHLVAEIVTARFLLAGLGYSAIVIFANCFVHERSVFDLLLIYGLSLWVLPLLLQWVFQGHESMNLVAMTQIIRQGVFVGIVLVFVRNEGGLLFVGVAEVASVTSAAVFSLWAYKRYFAGKLNFRPTLSGERFREALPIGVSQMFWVLRMFGATFVLGLIATTEDTGYFAGAMRIYIALHTFVWLYFFKMLPSLSRAWVEGPEKLVGLIRHSLKIVAFFSLIVGIVWAAAAPLVMISVYGPSFSPGAGALQWLAGACIAAALSGHYKFGLIAAGLQLKGTWTEASGPATGCYFDTVRLFPMGNQRCGGGFVFCGTNCFASAWLFARRSLFNVNFSRENCLVVCLIRYDD